VAPGPDHRYVGISSVNIYVRDQERSLRFYLDKLGFNLAFDAQVDSGMRWLAVSPPDGSTVLSLIQPAPNSAEHKLIGRATQVVFVTEDLPATYREWRERGVRFGFTPRLRRVHYSAAPGKETAYSSGEDQSSAWGGIFTRFEDVDGNSFVLASLDQVTRAIEARRRAAAEKLEAERRAAQELEIAKEVQARLLPQIQPACGGLDYSGACLPAREVGGDYYDFVELGPQRLGLVIADISGKGIAAALLMANLQANLRSQYAVAIDQPQVLLRSVNQLFYQSTSDTAYATLFFADYDGAAAKLRYVNCGHLPALLLHGDNSVERLKSTSTVLGLFEEWDCSTEEAPLVPGDTLALYTDGVTESFSPAGEEFGEQRLVECLCRCKDRAASAMVGAVVEELRRFSPHDQHDDITLIVAKCGTAS